MKYITGSTSKARIWTTDLIKIFISINLLKLISVLRLYKITILRKHSLNFIGIKGHNVCNLLSNGPGQTFNFQNVKKKQCPETFSDLIVKCEAQIFYILEASQVGKRLGQWFSKHGPQASSISISH